MLFDFHFSILHFEGIKEIKKIFGKKLILYVDRAPIVFFLLALQQILGLISYQELVMCIIILY